MSEDTITMNTSGKLYWYRLSSFQDEDFRELKEFLRKNQDKEVAWTWKAVVASPGTDAQDMLRVLHGDEEPDSDTTMCIQNRQGCDTHSKSSQNKQCTLGGEEKL